MAQICGYLAGNESLDYGKSNQRAAQVFCKFSALKLDEDESTSPVNYTCDAATALVLYSSSHSGLVQGKLYELGVVVNPGRRLGYTI